MILPLNKKNIKLLFDYHITSDRIGSTLIVLDALYNKNYDILDLLDNENKDLLFLQIYKDLEIKNIVYKTENSKILFDLTEKGIVLYKTIFESNKKQVFQTVEFVNSIEWLTSWVNLWKNERGAFFKTESYSLGGSIKEVQKKLSSFLVLYDYLFENMSEDQIKEVIFFVTQKYVSEKKKINFESTRKCANFIWKQEGSTKDSISSDLATLCEEYFSEKTNSKEKPRHNAYETAINT